MVEKEHPESASSAAGVLARVVAGIDKLLSPVYGVTFNFSKFILFVMMAIITLDVLGRNLFQMPIRGTYELVGLMMVTVIFLSFGVTEKHREHIEITFLTERWSPRTQAVLGALNKLVSFVLLLIIVWQFYVYTVRLYAGHNVTTYLHIPLYIFAIVASVGMLIYAFACLREFFVWLQKVVEGK